MVSMVEEFAPNSNKSFNGKLSFDKSQLYKSGGLHYVFCIGILYIIVIFGATYSL